MKTDQGLETLLLGAGRSVTSYRTEKLEMPVKPNGLAFNGNRALKSKIIKEMVAAEKLDKPTEVVARALGLPRGTSPTDIARNAGIPVSYLYYWPFDSSPQRRVDAVLPLLSALSEEIEPPDLLRELHIQRLSKAMVMCMSLSGNRSDVYYDGVFAISSRYDRLDSRMLKENLEIKRLLKMNSKVPERDRILQLVKPIAEMAADRPHHVDLAMMRPPEALLGEDPERYFWREHDVMVSKMEQGGTPDISQP